MWPCSPYYGCHGPGLYGSRLIGIVLGSIIAALLCLLGCWFINRRRRRRHFAEAAVRENDIPHTAPWSPPWPVTNRVAWYGSPDMVYAGSPLQSPPYARYQPPSSVSSGPLPPLPSPIYTPSSRSSHGSGHFVGGFRMTADSHGGH
ncbi:hypothetical protein OE88DRAFT_1398851 [Heliocybe sulcata]|uniref:Uncharacterized protein n=1 Tax=Heliocybe sulcata TaxID=5364 RepID=A0A5C3N549_9AGAM|nr:hypothetical protein OE88DRAFT_1398851 [Heliocybe sulcata]